jgi:hypothetical protein
VSASVLYMSMSLDGFIAGPNEGPDNGLGDGGLRLHDWNATNRPVSRCTEGESAPAVPPGARAIASQRTQRITEDTPAARRGGRARIAARAPSTAAGLNPSLGAGKSSARQSSSLITTRSTPHTL